MDHPEAKAGRVIATLSRRRSFQLPAPDRAVRLVERNALLYRRGWLLLISGFIEPLLYLLAIGFGVGALVSSTVTVDGHLVRYAVFVAPAMMATSAMNGAIFETAFNFFFKLKYVKLYDAVIATPLGIADIALGEITWALIRGTLYSFGFIVVMTALGLVASPWALLALPAAMLIGFTFSALGTAASTFVRTWQDFDLVLTVLIPLFLFSATFYPITVYPGPLQVVVQLTPLYHGVDLLRRLTTGIIGPSLLVDVAYLAVLGALALAVAATRLERQLLK
ncbi:MAG TPA: ABC transporter permease [Candidatus Dormibacteraeota bacterium]